MRAEHPAERVPLVDDDVAQRPQEPDPPAVVAQQREVQEVGVREDDVGVVLDPHALREGSVSIARGDPDIARARGVEQAGQRGGLIGRERLGGAQVQDARAASDVLDPAVVALLGAHGRERGKPERHRLAGPCARAESDVRAGPRGVGGLHLVLPGTRDTERGVASDEVGVGPLGPRRGRPGARGQVPQVREALRPPAPGQQHVEQILRPRHAAHPPTPPPPVSFPPEVTRGVRRPAEN